MGLEKGAQLMSWATHHVIPGKNNANNACIMENTEKGYRGRNIYILSDSQEAIRCLISR